MDDAAQRLRGPPCVALNSTEFQADPNRSTQYTFVPEEYRVEHGLSSSACVCRSNHCHRHVGLLGEPGKPDLLREKNCGCQFWETAVLNFPCRRVPFHERQHGPTRVRARSPGLQTAVARELQHVLVRSGKASRWCARRMHPPLVGRAAEGSLESPGYADAARQRSVCGQHSSGTVEGDHHCE
jgi:hypothetical protein